MFQKIKPYLLNFGVASGLFIGLALLQQFTPFGKETMLTVDLGQQYIDFFSLFRQTILQTPEQLLYSFQKAFGGEMIGLWSYYLLSPFNFIFLLFKEDQLALAVTMITYLKVVASSMTFYYFARHKYQLNTPLAILFSNSYAFMSYTIVYLLNIMWLDGLVLLPIIALGLDRMIRQHRYPLYISSLALLLIANYYIGYMTCLFLAIYAIFVIVENHFISSWKQAVISYSRFVLASIVSTAMSAVVLLPTLISLIASKASHMKNDFDWSTAHNVEAILSKFFIGSFNFDEMSKGSPNLYAGIFVLLFALYFFINGKIKLREKFTALGILLIFFLAFHFKAIDRIWHGGQFPIWYHFRFSFMTSFFLIVLAIKALKASPERYNLFVLIGGIVGLGAFTAYYYWIGKYTFLDETRLFITLVIGVTLIFIIQLERMNMTIRHWILCGIVVLELFSNAALIFSELSYVDLSKFNDYVATLDESLTGLRHSDHDFYRIHTTFQRSKNEAMFTHFSGMNHFGSTIEGHVPKLFGYLGLPDGSGFGNYSNGTLFTDDFFNIRYIINPTEDSASHTKDDEYVIFQIAKDIDLQAHSKIYTAPRFEIYENPIRFGLGMEVSDTIIQEETAFKDHNPVYNQELLLRLLDIDGNGKPYFTEHSIKISDLQNVKLVDNGDGDFYTYHKTDLNSDEAARINFKFDIPTTNPYYFTLPSQIEGDNADLQLNGERYKAYTPFRKRQLTNASYNEVKTNQTFSIELKKDELKINSVKLYEFDEQRYNNLVEQKQQSNFNVTQFAHNHIEGTMTITSDNRYALFTIPYDPYWSATVDGKKVKPISVLNDTLLALPLTKGAHHIVLHYFPSTIWIGLCVTLVGFVSFVVIMIGSNKYRQTIQHKGEIT